MGKYKNLLFYIFIIGGFSVLMYGIVILGTDLESGREILDKDRGFSQWEEFLDSLSHNLHHPLAILLLQIITIIIVARAFGWLFKKIGQPTVIGEIIAGIVLGPSLVGYYFPEFSAMLFPTASLGNLQFLSQIGLILFMFVVGMELDLKVLRNKAHDAVVISHASIIIPFALGMGLAYYIYESFAPMGVKFSSFGLFLGIAMSITAFPVLARIVQERGMTKTRLGTVVITCAAADDISAWCILAAVIAIVKAGSFVSSLYVIALAVVYVIIMIKVVKPFLNRIGNLYYSQESLSKPVVGIFFLTLLVSSYTTEVIGIHALFGAFMAGAIMPENLKFRNIFIEKVEDVALVLLLPLFFVFTGLRTQIGLLNDPYLWKVTALIILVAVIGKFVGSALAAKFVGQNWKDSLAIGALMNTRGLMELVVLNIGYDLGVLNPEIFAMMVIMALVTTFMTGPALDILEKIFKKSPDAAVPDEVSQHSQYRTLISFGHPERGRTLLRLADSLSKRLNGNSPITVMHLTDANELNLFNKAQYEKDSFLPTRAEAIHLNRKVTTVFKPSHDIENTIAETANEGNYDLLLIGFGQSIFEGSLLGKILGFTSNIINPEKLFQKVIGKENIFEGTTFDDRVKTIVSKSKVPVGILLDKGFNSAERIFIPVFSESDLFLVEYARKFITNAQSQVSILDATGLLRNNPTLKEPIRLLEQNAPQHIELIQERIIDSEFLSDKTLMLVSMDSWKKMIYAKNVWLTDVPSTLILVDK